MWVGGTVLGWDSHIIVSNCYDAASYFRTLKYNRASLLLIGKRWVCTGIALLFNVRVWCHTFTEHRSAANKASLSLGGCGWVSMNTTTDEYESLLYYH